MEGLAAAWLALRMCRQGIKGMPARRALRVKQALMDDYAPARTLAVQYVAQLCSGGCWCWQVWPGGQSWCQLRLLSRHPQMQHVTASVPQFLLDMQHEHVARLSKDLKKQRHVSAPACTLSGAHPHGHCGIKGRRCERLGV